jgi:hypothetical protein
MSWPGRQALAHLERGELQIERNYWHQYRLCLTPAEKKQIRNGDYSSFRRPYLPAFTEGTVLPVGRNLAIEIAAVQFKRGHYRVDIARVQDFRSSGTPIRTYGEDAASMENTLSISADRVPNPPEPTGVDPVTLKLYAAEAGAKRVLGDNEKAEATLAEIRQLPARRRMVELHKLASERGVDVRDDVKAFERRVMKRLGRAA